MKNLTEYFLWREEKLTAISLLQLFTFDYSDEGSNLKLKERRTEEHFVDVLTDWEGKANTN